MELDEFFNLPLSPIDLENDRDYLSPDVISYGLGSDSTEKLALIDRSFLPSAVPPSPKGKLSSVHRNKAPKRRKLPGPAGLLPQGNTCDILAKAHSCPTRVKKHMVVPKDGNNSLSLSQASDNQSEESVLLSLLRKDCGSVIWPSIEKYSISYVLQLISRGSLPRGKVPVMCGFLDDVELSPTDAKAVLRDLSGSLGCTIHRSVIKEYKNQLANCVLLLLKQVSLFSPTGKNFYLNITLSNVVRVYTPERIFPVLTSSRSVNLHFNNPPLLPSDLDSLEADCLKPLSPPPSPVSKRVSPLRMRNEDPLPTRRPQTRTSHTPSVQSSERTAPRPAPIRKVTDSVRNASLDQSPYRLTSTPSTKGTKPALPSFARPGLGSLVRSSCATTPRPVSSNHHPEPTTAELEVSTSSDLQATRLKNVEHLLDDGMDDFLSSLAEESMCSLWS